ncbi:MAG: TnpV protein [Eubacteriales bacterium]
MEKHIIGENGIGYTLGDDGIYYPNLSIPEGTHYPIGKYGRMREAYIREHRRYQWLQLIMNGELNQHLHEVDEMCWEQIDKMVKQMAKAHGLTEQMKSEQQLYWVGMMNNFHNAAEEVVLKEVVYN